MLTVVYLLARKVKQEKFISPVNHHACWQLMMGSVHIDCADWIRRESNKILFSQLSAVENAATDSSLIAAETNSLSIFKSD